MCSGDPRSRAVCRRFSELRQRPRRLRRARVDAEHVSTQRRRQHQLGTVAQRGPLRPQVRHHSARCRLILGPDQAAEVQHAVARPVRSGLPAQRFLLEPRLQPRRFRVSRREDPARIVRRRRVPGSPEGSLAAYRQAAGGVGRVGPVPLSRHREPARHSPERLRRRGLRRLPPAAGYLQGTLQLRQRRELLERGRYGGLLVAEQPAGGHQTNILLGDTWKLAATQSTPNAKFGFTNFNRNYAVPFAQMRAPWELLRVGILNTATRRATSSRATGALRTSCIASRTTCRRASSLGTR